MKKLLSIIVASYNMEKFLQRGLDSLLINNPLVSCLDVIVVNDGSTDGTSDIANAYERRYPESVSVLEKANGHYGSCINAGLAVAKGAYLKLLDADDYVDTPSFVRYLEFLSDCMRSQESPDVVFTDYAKVDTTDRVVRQDSFAFTGKISFSLGDLNFQSGRYLHHAAVTYRTHLLKDFGYHQIENVLYSDLQWISIPMLHVQTLRYCPQCVYKYTIGRTDQSCNEEMLIRNFDMHLCVFKEIISSYLKQKKNAEEDSKTYLETFISHYLYYIYHRYLLRSYKVLNLKSLQAFDEWLRLHAPMFYQRFEHFSTFSFLGPGRFFFVRSWRKHGSRRSWGFFLYDLSHRAELILH